MTEGERLRWRGVEVSVVVSLGLGQLGRARHEDPLACLACRDWRGAEVDMMETVGSDGGRGQGRSHFLVLSEAQVITQQGEDVGPEGAEGGEKVESSSFSCGVV